MSGSNTSIGTITAANVVYMLVIPLLYPSPQQLQGFATDMAFESDEAEIAETQMGVDGFFVGGYVPVPFRESLSFLAASPSCKIFDNWYEAQKVTQSIFYATATIYQPAVSRKIVRQQGVLRSYQPIAPAKKILEARKFIIEWGSTDGAVL